MGQLSPAHAKNCSLLILAYLLSFFRNRKEDWHPYLSFFTDIKFVEFEEVASNQKEKKRKQAKTNTRKQLPTLIN